MVDFALPDLDTKTLAESGVEVPLTKLDGETAIVNANNEPVSITVLGADSATFRRLTREYQRKRLDIMQKAGGKILSDEQLDQLDAAELRMYATATVGWSGLLDSKGKAVPFTLENVIALYTNMPPAREQAVKAVSDRTRFIQPSSQGS